MWTWKFWRETLERAVKTAAQAPLTAWLVGDKVLNALTIDWNTAAGLAAGGAVISILTSLATMKIGADDSPSAIN